MKYNACDKHLSFMFHVCFMRVSCVFHACFMRVSCVFHACVLITIVIGSDLYSREWLDGYLSQALNLKLENGRLSVIDDSEYVLTLDYTIKMLNIHERHECAVPVIIEGETGVGKTALVEMLSKLWNQSLLLEWKKQKGRLLDFFLKKLGDIDTISENYQVQQSIT